MDREIVDIHTMEYYAVPRKNKIIQFSKSWMELEEIMLSEVKEKERDKWR